MKKLLNIVLRKLSNFIQTISLFLFIILFNFNSNAISLNNVKESVQYGKQTSFNEACTLAEEKLFDKARRLASGVESLSADSIQIVNYEVLKFENGDVCKFSSLGNNIFEASRKGNFILKKNESDKDNNSFKWTSSENDNETVFNEGYNNPKITCTDKDGNVFSRDKNVYKSCDELFEKISNNNSMENINTLKQNPISKPAF